MGPKVAAAAAFIEGGGRRAIITSVEKIEAAIYDTSVGTQFSA